MKNHALNYVKNGFSVIPLRARDKKPAISSWSEYQRRRPTEEELKEWFENKNHNIGIVTGEISGIAVVDLDSQEAVNFSVKHNFPLTPLVKTGKGYHAYYRYKDGVRNFQKRDDLPGIDLRGDGGYVVAPPSIHPSGHRYRWVEGKGLEDIPLAELPSIVLVKNMQEKTPLRELYSGVQAGSRNDTLARLCGSWVNNGLSYEECFENALIWNDKNSPPLEEREIITTIKSILSKHQRNSSDKSQTDKFNPDRIVGDNDFFNKKIFELAMQDKIHFAWLFENLLYQNTVNLLDGLGGSRKSTLAMQLALNIIFQNNFLCFPFANKEPGVDFKNVFYLTTKSENPEEVAAYKLKQLIQHYDYDLEDIERHFKIIYSTQTLLERSGSGITPSVFFKNLQSFTEQYKPDLLIIDPVLRFAGIDLNKNDEVALFYNFLETLETTVLLIHHQPKNSKFQDISETTQLGATALRDLARCRIVLKAKQFYIEKNNYSRYQNCLVEHSFEDGVFTTAQSEPYKYSYCKALEKKAKKLGKINYEKDPFGLN